MKKRILAMVTILTLAVTLLAGCGKGASSSGGTIKIGTISPNTGNMSAYGDAVTKAWKLAAKEINDAGGVLGKKIELIEKDDQMDSTETLNAFNSLIAEDVVAVLGSVSSGCTSAITDVADEEKILLITPTSTADSITTTDDFVFRACYADSFQGKIAAKYAADNGYKEVGVLYSSADTYSKGLYDSFASACAEYGVTVKIAESVASIDEKEFTNQWAAIAESGVGFVFSPFYYYSVGPYIVPQAREAGYTGIIMGADGYDGTTDYISEGTDLSYYNDVLFTNHYDPADSSTVVQNFVNAYKAEYNNETPNALAALAYDSLYMLAKAIENAGSEESVKIRDALADTSVNYECVTGTFKLDSTGTPSKGASVIEYKYDEATDTVVTSLRSVVTSLE